MEKENFTGLPALEDILQEYFGCKGNAFLKNPRNDGEDICDYFTKAGAKAYEKLTLLFEKLEAIEVIDDAGSIIDQLDCIVRYE